MCEALEGSSLALLYPFTTGDLPCDLEISNDHTWHIPIIPETHATHTTLPWVTFCLPLLGFAESKMHECAFPSTFSERTHHLPRPLSHCHCYQGSAALGTVHTGQVINPGSSSGWSLAVLKQTSFSGAKELL